jgi:hypothetical protein
MTTVTGTGTGVRNSISCPESCTTNYHRVYLGTAQETFSYIVRVAKMTAIRNFESLQPRLLLQL